MAQNILEEDGIPYFDEGVALNVVKFKDVFRIKEVHEEIFTAMGIPFLSLLRVLRNVGIGAA